MSLLATLALAASLGSGTVLPQCSWDHPGVNPYMGDVVAAVDDYRDIPAATREKLKARMRERRYDEIAVIERDAIKGKATYEPGIRDMHFGPGSMCRSVTRSKWTATMQERGLVYCEDGQCILVPTVCRNVSRITRKEVPRAVAPAHAVNVAASTREEGDAPLVFDPPAAGPAAAPDSFAASAKVPSLSVPTPSTPTINPGPSPLPPVTVPPIPLPPGHSNIPAVPEPSTWAMILAGLFVVARKVGRQT